MIRESAISLAPGRSECNGENEAQARNLGVRNRLGPLVLLAPITNDSISIAIGMRRRRHWKASHLRLGGLAYECPAQEWSTKHLVLCALVFAHKLTQPWTLQCSVLINAPEES